MCAECDAESHCCKIGNGVGMIEIEVGWGCGRVGGEDIEWVYGSGNLNVCATGLRYGNDAARVWA